MRHTKKSPKNNSNKNNNKDEIDDDTFENDPKNINKHMPIIQECIKQAIKSPLRCQHGAIVVDVKGKIIGRGFNKYRGLNFNGTDNGHRKSIHAEEDALNSCKKEELNGAELYVIRANFFMNEITNSKPCHNCQKIIKFYIKKFGLKCVYYSGEINLSINQDLISN